MRAARPSREEGYAVLAGQVADTGDAAGADLLSDLDGLQVFRDLREIREFDLRSGSRNRERARVAEYEDREVVVEGNLVTARRPADLPTFMRENLRLLRARSATRE